MSASANGPRDAARIRMKKREILVEDGYLSPDRCRALLAAISAYREQHEPPFIARATPGATYAQARGLNQYLYSQAETPSFEPNYVPDRRSLRRPRSHEGLSLEISE